MALNTGLRDMRDGCHSDPETKTRLGYRLHTGYVLCMHEVMAMMERKGRRKIDKMGPALAGRDEKQTKPQNK